MPNLYDKLLLILEKINYSQDKEQFAGKFVLNVYMIVLLSLADTLDDANKSTFLNELTQKSTNGENPRDLLLQHFTDDQIASEEARITREQLVSYVQSLEPHVSSETYEEILSIVQ